jgi:hypothetical protein
MLVSLGYVCRIFMKGMHTLVLVEQGCASSHQGSKDWDSELHSEFRKG